MTAEVTCGDYVTGEILWKIELDDKDQIAGMVSMGMAIIWELNTTNNTNLYIDTNIDISDYRVVNSVGEESIDSMSCGRLFENEKGIWMNSGDSRFKYSLYKFTKPSFFQGVKSISDDFNDDYRNYIYGVPFDGYGNQYTFLNSKLGNDLLIGVTAPDLDDIEEDESYDENVYAPWDTKDDVDYEQPEMGILL